jgi:hypothetical protein
MEAVIRFKSADGRAWKSQPEPLDEHACNGCAFRSGADADLCSTAPNCGGPGVIFVADDADESPGTPVGATAGPARLLSGDAAERKATPITTGVLDYFPRALAAVAQCSKAGNDQHNPGQPLHWDKTKSPDHADCIARHLIDRHTVDTDGVRHATKLAWRALALLETLLEKEATA